VEYIADPMEDAIQKFQADRDLARLGYDPTDDEVKPLRRFLAEHALIWEIVYDIPDEFQSLTEDLVRREYGIEPAGQSAGDAEKSAAPDNAAPDNVQEDGDSRPGTKAASDSGDRSEADASEDEPAGSEQPAAATGGSAGESPPAAGGDTAAMETEGVIEPAEMAELLSALPDPSALEPRLQLRESKRKLSSLKPEEPFMIWVKAGFIVGAVISSPMVFYHLWSFVAAGLYPHERKYVYIYLPVSVTLFIGGVVLAFFLVLQYVLSFLLTFNNSMEVAAEPRLSYYINFVLLLPLGFGIAFQLPIVMLFLQRIGLFETEQYIASWRIAVLVIFLLSMVLTPADVTSMVALAVPLIFLYLLGILMCKFIPRGRGLGSAAYDPA